MSRRAWAAAVIGTLKIQILVIGALSTAFLAVAGTQYAIACAASGAAVCIPHFVTGLVLWMRTALTGHLSAATLLGSEGLKLLLIIAALYGARRWLGPDMMWPGFIAGLIGALMAQWLSLWVSRNS